MPSPVRFAEFEKMMNAKGYTWTRTAGSHRIFTKPGARSFPVPVHKGQVKYGYVRQIEKL